MTLKCNHCGKEIYVDMEQDLIHKHLENKGCDPRLCEPKNPNSKVAIEENHNHTINEDFLEKLIEHLEQAVIILDDNPEAKDDGNMYKAKYTAADLMDDLQYLKGER